MRQCGFRICGIFIGCGKHRLALILLERLLRTSQAAASLPAVGSTEADGSFALMGLRWEIGHVLFARAHTRHILEHAESNCEYARCAYVKA